MAARRHQWGPYWRGVGTLLLLRVIGWSVDRLATRVTCMPMLVSRLAKLVRWPESIPPRKELRVSRSWELWECSLAVVRLFVLLTLFMLMLGVGDHG